MPPSTRYILHADLDAFYASVEQRDNPRLRGRPLVVGGSPGERGVVAAASYEARKYGIHSAMPMRTALRLCPELVRVSPRFPRYREVSRRVMNMFRRLTPRLEPLSLDEAYLDISGRGPVDEAARRLRAGVLRETGLPLTVGGGTCKTVAKVASQVAKPNGLLLVRPGEERDFLAPLDVDILSGVGPKTAALLKEYGVNTLADLADCDEAWLRRAFGKRGPEMRERALGIDHGSVQPHRETKSVSAETTMAEDVGDEAALVEKVDELAGGVATRLQGEGLRGKTVWIKLRLADFRTFTRQITFAVSTNDKDVILRTACELLRRETGPGRKFRLVGVGVTNFSEASQLALFPPA
ncbi:MAG: DNA polymerase IV [Dehalococcoidia bacterium]